MLRVVLLTGQSPAVIARLIERVRHEVPEAAMTGVLLEERRGRPFRERLRNFARNLGRKGFVSYVLARTARQALSRGAAAGHATLRWLHGAPNRPLNQLDVDRDGLERWLGDRGVAFHRTTDLHSPEALRFVLELQPDLGVVFGTRILKPELFEIPRLGSINIHKRKVPEYRGGGPIGLWELLDDQTDIGVTVHRVAVQVDAGDVLHSAVIRVDPYDTLDSLGWKADVVGDDLLIRTIADHASGHVRARPQPPGGRTFRTPPPHELHRLRAHIRSRRPPPPLYRPSRPLWKLAGRVAVLGPAAILRNRRHRRAASFPIVILYHHVITDRDHALGMSTFQFKRHIDYLSRHYRILSLPNAIEALASGVVDVPTVVLTFDDGYADNFINVRAVTEPIGVPVTFFVSTANIAQGTPFAHDVAAGDTEFAPLTWDQVRGLRSAGHTIGSHTRSHFNCGSTDIIRLESEIAGSRDDLERELGPPLPWFSFPWGLPERMSAPAVEMALASYEWVFSACGGVNQPGRVRERRHLLRCPHPNNLLELALAAQDLMELDPPGPQLPF